uniref:C-type lectin n=1 Tax=Sinonovacula constricta TaxID=98310 RepID=A0A7D4XC52_SINCO|nr:C-type lectin [Sinonovacula constricta]
MEFRYYLPLFLFLLNNNKHLIVATESDKCEISVNGCDYQMVLLPSNSCLSSQEEDSRVKRSAVTQVIQTPPNTTVLVGYIKGLQALTEKHQHKLTKEMRKLSKRVLRGVRKFETLLDNLEEKPMKIGMGAQEPCPPGFVHLKGWPFCYLFSRFNASWYEARDFCNAFDSDMVSLGSLKEHYVVTFLIKNHPDYSHAEGWWTSGAYISKTKQWMWTSEITMEPFTFVKWATNEPNDVSLQCVLMYSGDDHLWHDRLCTDRYNFVCEAPLNQPKH